MVTRCSRWQTSCTASARAGPERSEIVIGYGSGTATHDVDFEEAAAALVEVLEGYPTVQMWIAGPLRISPQLEDFGARVQRFPLTGWRDWFELLNAGPANASVFMPAPRRRAYQMGVEALGLLKMRLPEVEIILSARVSSSRRPLSPSASGES